MRSIAEKEKEDKGEVVWMSQTIFEDVFSSHSEKKTLKEKKAKINFPNEFSLHHRSLSAFGFNILCSVTERSAISEFRCHLLQVNMNKMRG
jgi:hypothetical protein